MAGAGATAGLSVHPTGAGIGAEVRGLDLREPLAPESLGRLRAAWHEHLVLLFRDQRLDDAQHFAFTGRLGPLEHEPGRLLAIARGDAPETGHPDITVISNVVENGRPIGRLGHGEALWHSDSNFVEVPPAASILRAIEVPPHGGNTSFMNMYAALERLPDDLRARVDGLRVKHDPAFNSAGERRSEYGTLAHPADGPGPVHPLVRTHPETGRRALYLGRRTGAWVVGLPVPDSEALLDRLWEEVAARAPVWEHEWRAGDVILWDNRCAMHRRDAFDGAERRVMHRTQLAGDRPV